MHISAVYLYPVKSCRRVPLQRAVVTPEGLAFDRNWIIVDAAGKLISQREQPRLALVQPSLSEEALVAGAKAAIKLPGAALTLTAPDMPTLNVPLRLPEPLKISQVKLWSWQGAAIDEGIEAAEWLTSYLGKPARLMRHAGAAAGEAAVTAAAAAAGDDAGPLTRPADEDFTQGWNMRFQDEMPLLITTEASLSALSAQVEETAQPLPMTRFRPNIVIGGADKAWAEDTWHTLQIQPAQQQDGGQPSAEPLQVVLAKPCMRCGMIRVDPELGQRGGQEPTETLSKIRTGEVLGWSHWHKTFKLGHFFGWLAVPLVASDAAGAVVAVGDAVQVAAPRPAGASMAPIVNPTPAA